MALDTTAVMAILQQEAEAAELARKIGAADGVSMSAASVLDFSMTDIETA